MPLWYASRQLKRGGGGVRELERGKKKLNILGGMMLVRVVFFLAGAGIICRPVTGWVQPGKPGLACH